MISGTLGEKTVEKFKERVPGFLGISLEDERIGTGIWAELNQEEKKLLSDFLSTCSEYERNRFRNIVTGIPFDEQKQGATNKTVKNEMAIKFLKEMAKTIEIHGQEEARRQCLAMNIFIENPLHQKALEKWKEGLKSFDDWLGEEVNGRRVHDLRAIMSERRSKMPKKWNLLVFWK
jgi:hypothetical protein